MVVLEQRGCWRRRGGHLARLYWVVGVAAKMSRNDGEVLSWNRGAVERMQVGVVEEVVD